MVLHFLELVVVVLVLPVVVPVLLFGVKVVMVKELLLLVHSIP
jgi:ABC-type transport system involved in cytochrome c biogenesis permease component